MGDRFSDTGYHSDRLGIDRAVVRARYPRCYGAPDRCRAFRHRARRKITNVRFSSCSTCDPFAANCRKVRLGCPQRQLTRLRSFAKSIQIHIALDRLSDGFVNVSRSGPQFTRSLGDCCHVRGVLTSWFAPLFSRDRGTIKADILTSTYLLNHVESLIDLMHNLRAFTSPVDEVVAWGEDTWP
jgi:hypothetical protein